MSRNILDLARTRALALSPASAHEQLDRAAADAMIRRAMRDHGGVHGCAAALARQYGEYPELAAPRMRWASQRVAALYRPAGSTIRGRLILRARSAAAAARLVVRDHSRHGHTLAGWPFDQLAAA